MLSIRMTKEYELKEGKNINDNLQKGQAKIYKFNVPNEPSIHSITIDMGIIGNTSKVHMYAAIASDENTQPDSSNSIHVSSSWFGLSARAYEGRSNEFCRNCTYKVLISSNEKVIYSLLYQTNKRITKIREDTYARYEMVSYSERNCYEKTIVNKDDVLEINLNTYSGDPDIFVNPKILPENQKDFAFHTAGNLDEALSITPQQRREHQALTGTYFICIYGSMSSSYGIFINVLKEGEVKKQHLYSGLTRTSEVKNGELKLFSYPIYYDEKMNITFSLTSLSGNADLYIKFCVEEVNDYGTPLNECELNKNTLNNADIFKSEQVSSTDIITFLYDPLQCSGTNKQCSYLIGVLGKSNSKFSLSVIGDPQIEVPLAEGRSVYGYVDHRGNSYYTFVVTDPDTESIKVQLTSLSGDADLYVSRFKKGSRTESEQFSNNLSYMPDTIVFNKKEHGFLNGSYHINIFGHTAATYTIMYVTSSQKVREKAILLTDGIPQMAIINDTEGVLCYFYAPPTKKDLVVHLTPISGHSRIYMGANYIPTENNYTWMMTEFDRDIRIVASDINYVTNGKYNILILKAIVEDSNPCIASVKYTTGSFHTTLAERQPEIGNLTYREIHYYKYNVISFEGSITVAVTPFSGDPDLYISVNSSNQNPNFENRDYASVSIGADHIRIPVIDILTKTPDCLIGLFTSAECSIYIGVKCASETCTYNLQVGRSSEFIMNLIDGYPQFGTVSTNDPQYYVYRPNTMNESTIISVYPKKGKVKAYVSLARVSERRDIKPNATSHDLETINRANTAMLMIPEEKSEQCGRLCRYYIGVYDDSPPSVAAQISTSEFTIVATSSVRQLIEDQTIIDYVDIRKYRYYRFNVRCNDCTLTIAVTPISAGDPDLYVNAGRRRIPSKEVADFKSIAYKGDLLQIQVNDTLGHGWRQSYLIAVYGSQNSTYSLTVTTSASLIREINQGVPVRQEQREGKISYFIFYSWKKANIVISLAIRSGRATIRANVVDNIREISVLDKLPSSELKSTWSSLQRNTLNYLTIETVDANYKESGVYLIGVEAEEVSSYEVTVEYESNEDYKVLKLAESYRVTLRQNEKKRYSFEVNSHEDVRIRLSSFYGSVDGSISTLRNGDPQWTFRDNLGLQIPSTHANFKLGTYYLTLTAQSNSDLTFMIEYKQDYMWLSEGLPQIAEVGPGKPAYFLYNIPNDIKEKEINLNIYVTLPDTTRIRPKMYLRHVTKDDYTMPDNSRYDHMAEWDPDLKQLGITVNLNTRKSSTLAIAVISPDTAKTSFDIVGWTAGFALLTLDHMYSNKFFSINEAHVYQLSLTRAPRIYIEVIPCTGEVEFFVSKTLANINDRKYDMKKTELSKGKLFGALENPEGIYYVSVRSVALAENKDFAQYTIRTFRSDESSADNLEDFTLESYGNIDISFSGDKVSLNWGVPYLRKGKTRKMMITYSVYMSVNSEENMYTICGIKYGNAEKILTDTTKNSIEYSLKKQRSKVGKDGKFTFNVIANIYDYNYTVAYNPVSLQLSNPPRFSKFGRIIMIAALVLLVVLGGAAIYFWRKYKTAMKELHYEMNDVRNLGNISAGREMAAERAEAYLHLRSVGEE